MFGLQHWDSGWNVSTYCFFFPCESEKFRKRHGSMEIERLLKSNRHDFGTRCFVSKKELPGSKSVSGEPTESNYSQCCDISLQRTWKTRLLSHVHQLHVGLYVPKWLTRCWPHHGQGSLLLPTDDSEEWLIMPCVLIILCFDCQIFSHDLCYSTYYCWYTNSSQNDRWNAQYNQ